METPEKPVQLKVFIDEKEKKVVFAEAGADFVDILLSFFTLPLGTIARLSLEQADSKDIEVGSLTCLYESVANLNAIHFFEEWYKELLSTPINPSASICEKLKVNLNELIIHSVAGCQGDTVFVKSMANFIITDDLSVVPITLDTGIAFLNSLVVGNIHLLEERTMYFGLEEFLNLLKWSLLTNNPLTNLVLGEGKPCSSFAANSTLSNSDVLTSSSSGKTQTLKLLVQKSNKKLLCAQVENPFVELLFSFLTIPLGAAIHLTKDVSCASGIRNLHNSVSCLGDGKFLKSKGVKAMLLCPKVATRYHCVTDFLPIYEVNTSPGHFLKEQATFIVSHNLEVSASPSIATFAKFNTLGVFVDDMEVLEVSFGEHEALLLLEASLTSTSALTDFVNASNRKLKVESSN